MLRGLRPVESATFRPQGNGEIAIERRGGCWCFLFFRSNLEKIQVLTVLVLASEKQKNTNSRSASEAAHQPNRSTREPMPSPAISARRNPKDPESPTLTRVVTLSARSYTRQAQSARVHERFASSCWSSAGRPPNKALHRTRRVRWLGRYRGPGTAKTARRQGRCISLPPVLPSVAAAALPLWCWRGWRRAGERQVR